VADRSPPRQLADAVMGRHSSARYAGRAMTCRHWYTVAATRNKLATVRSCSQQYCLHGTAPRYLQDVIQPVAVTSRRRLRSTSSSALVVPVTRRTMIGDRAFAVAGPRAWNSLPQFVTDCPSPGTFRKYLKTYLFSLSF